MKAWLPDTVDPAAPSVVGSCLRSDTAHPTLTEDCSKNDMSNSLHSGVSKFSYYEIQDGVGQVKKRWSEEGVVCVKKREGLFLLGIKNT